MKIPIAQQFDFLRELLPRLETLGILYCSEMPQAVATGEEAAQAASRFGWRKQITTLPASELDRLDQKVRELSRKVDAIYIPTDPILGTPENLQLILSITDDVKIPVIGVAEKLVENGVLAAVHSDFYELGRQIGEQAVDYLQNNGVNVMILDMVMEPGIDGLETYRRILPHQPGQKVVKANGFSESEQLHQLQEISHGMYIKKPYTLEVIGEAARRTLDGQ